MLPHVFAFLPTVGYSEMVLLVLMALMLFAGEMAAAVGDAVRTVIGRIRGDDLR